MTDAERLESIKEFIRTYGFRTLHADDIRWLLAQAEKVVKNASSN